MNRKVERTITIAAKPERVFQAWVEEINQRWTKPYYNDHDRIFGLYRAQNRFATFDLQFYPLVIISKSK
jgi:hypothetical protein